MAHRAVVYTRVSTKEQVNNLSLDTQRQRCIAYCGQMDYEVVKVFTDGGESAKSVNRTALQQMLSFVNERKNMISFLVVHDLSRFSRNMEDLGTTIVSFASAGIGLRSVTENVDETTEGKLLRNITGT